MNTPLEQFSLRPDRPLKLKPPIRVTLYADEVHPFRNRLNQQWMYIAIVAVPNDELESGLTLLNQSRQETGYNGEVHFSEATTRARVNTGKLWLRHVLHDTEKRFHFYMLGLHLDNLQRQVFGDRGRKHLHNIYNRFFRTAVAYVLKSYFRDHERIVVSRIFHDESEMKYDKLFDWHSIWRVDKSYANVSFETSMIEFIDSDHRKEPRFPEHSHFVQLADLILGACKQCLDLTSMRRYAVELGEEFLPLMQRLCDEAQRKNRNSRYRHVGRCGVSFFPSRSLTVAALQDQWKRGRSGFFCNRTLLIQDYLNGQRSLFELVRNGKSE